jgi:hypothetical protein
MSDALLGTGDYITWIEESSSDAVENNHRILILAEQGCQTGWLNYCSGHPGMLANSGFVEGIRAKVMHTFKGLKNLAPHPALGSNTPLRE